EFKGESNQLEVGDRVMITGPTTGYIETTIEELRLDDKPVSQVGKGDTFSFKVGEKIRPSDKLYKIVEA
ncbi:MAG: U32 family peptidase, partial [Chitinophagales bacterium]